MYMYMYIIVYIYISHVACVTNPFILSAFLAPGNVADTAWIVGLSSAPAPALPWLSPLILFSADVSTRNLRHVENYT